MTFQLKIYVLHVACLLSLMFICDIQAEEQNQPSESSRISNFVLRDQTGKTRSLYSEKTKASVVVFMGTECPLAKLYAQRLQEMASSTAYQNVNFYGIMSNQHDSDEDIVEYARQHEISFPLLKDLHNRVADQFAAERTPEAFLLDDEYRIRYRGRIDDQFGIGTLLKEPRSHDLKNALDELLAGKNITFPVTNAVGCIIGREPKMKPTQKITFSRDIIRIFQEKCIDCHREGQVAPFALSEYEEVKGWAGMIEEVVREGRMPPWHADPRFGEFKNDCSLEESQKQMIFDWVAAGAPEGNPADYPQENTYSTLWQLPREPDLILPITKEPVAVPATGEVKYQYYKVDPGLTEDKWLQAAEIRPGNYAVVHHILVFARDKDSKGRGAGGEEGGFLAAYVPGLIPQPFPKGMAKKIPANSELIFQVHYTPIGSPQEDLSQFALIFADPEQVTHQVMTTSATNRHFEIPPGANNHEVTAFSPRAKTDVQLLTMMPHMHLRGKSFDYEVQYPDGKKQKILSVPKYDFNWQTSYRLSEPITLPQGTRLFCTAHFDNSTENAFNPDPTSTVRWGDQTWEEMMIGYCDIVVPLDQSQATNGGLGGRADQIIARLDQNGDGHISKDETPAKWWAIFLLVDTDRNGEVTAEELEIAGKKFERD
ncbi:redoxin domain-containing protein [uncultured Rubinisphaera sp.]|uniref:redoxin domain-containing protein n=1 Tax=uncultured Rubinisphaera sp. TaxID=1678686 RepID=UPI0030DBCEF8